MCGFVLAILGTPSVRSQNATTTISVSANPGPIAVNPVANKIYVINGLGSVVAIDGATNTATTIAVSWPIDIAVNPVTNKVYVASSVGSGIVSSVFMTVIDGATNATTTIPDVFGPIAVNPVTNKIYVATSSNVTVIGGATNATSTVAVASRFGAIAVNPATNRIYVAVFDSNTVAVIDGATNAITTVAVGSNPAAIAVNPVTNRIYVVTGANVTVIDGATNAVTTVAVGSAHDSIVVNPVTNKVYVSNYFDNTVTVIDGATNATATVVVGSNPATLAVNPVTNRIYVVTSANVTVIDGATNATATVTVGSYPLPVAVNPVTDRVYVSNTGDGTVTVIDGGPSAPRSPLARLTNISARAQVGTGGNVLIPGFVIGGSGTETLLIRGSGPGLAPFGVSGALAKPSLSVFNSAGTMVASNTGWGTNSNPAQIASVAAQVGAFAFASGSADCALVVSLPAGAYTVQVSGVSNTTGVALAEVYEVSSSGARLVNLSTRAQAGTGANIIIAGFVISGTGTEELLMRADGPALAQFGVPGVLGLPSLSVFDQAGNVVASNTGWATNPDPGLIAAFAADAGAFPLPSGPSGITSSDSAQFLNLPPGAYTMQVSGTNSSTGDALAEIYEAP
jgi:YVTN family beta-propeller protein